MHEFLAPFEAQFVQQKTQNLKVIILLVAHDVDHLINVVVVEALRRRADVLRHIDARSISAQEEFLIQAVGRKVDPYRTVVLAEEESLRQAFQYLCFAVQIGFALVINLVEAYAECAIRLIEAGIHPIIHLLPKAAHLRVVLFPFHEHFARLFH